MALAMPEVVVESAVSSPLARPLHSSPLPAAHCVRAHLLGPWALAAHLPRARLFLRYYCRSAHSGQAACLYGRSGQESALRTPRACRARQPAAEQGECRPAARHCCARAERSRRTAGRLLLWRTDRGTASRLDARSTALPSSGCRAVPCRRQALMAATTCKCSAPGSVSEQDSLNSSLNALPSSLASKRPASLNQTWNICTPPHAQRQRAEILNCRYCILV